MNNKEALQISPKYNNAKLLPCPFCGEVDAKPMLTWQKMPATTNVEFVISCTNCGCAPVNCSEIPEKAIHFWNKRKEMPRSEEALVGFECARELLKKLVNDMPTPFEIK